MLINLSFSIDTSTGEHCIVSNVDANVAFLILQGILSAKKIVPKEEKGLDKAAEV